MNRVGGHRTVLPREVLSIVATVLFSSAGRRVALMGCFRDAFGVMGTPGRVLATDMTPLSPAYQMADASFAVPRCTSPEFIPAMLEICRREAVTLVVPTIDTELPAYAAARDQFEKIGTVVAISGPQTVAIGGDKIRTQEWLRSEGFPTVRQVSVEAVRADWSAWPFPLMVKPAGGSASIGVQLVRDRLAFDAAVEMPGAIVQSVARGVEHTVDVLVNRKGKVVCVVPRRRLEVRAGEVSKGMTVRDSRLIGLASEIGARLPDAYGVLNIQIFLDPDSGEMSVIEINPRFGGGFPLAYEAGAKYPQWMLEEILGLPSSVAADGWRDGLVMLRYDAAVFVDRERVGL